MHVQGSPIWLKGRLEVLGQKSINNIVDAANFVMYDIGQPLHAFDADKVTGSIIVRKSLSGETIMTLTVGKSISTKDADYRGRRGSSGDCRHKGRHKGRGQRKDEKDCPGVGEFRTGEHTAVKSMRLGIKTDASKRFENGISPVLTDEAMEKLCVVIRSIAGTSTHIGRRLTFTPKSRNRK